MTAPLELYIRDGSRFVRVDEPPPRRPHRPLPAIPTPVRVPDETPYVDALGRPGPSCGQHIASWAAYTDPTGRPACKLCDTSRRTRRAR